MPNNFTLANKLSRLRERLKSPEWRRYGSLLLTGKLAGIGLLTVMFMLTNPDLIGWRTFAADAVLRETILSTPLTPCGH